MAMLFQIIRINYLNLFLVAGLIISLSSYGYGQYVPGRVKPTILKSIVKINTPNSHFRTGFLVSRVGKGSNIDLFLVTNKHVIGDWNLADGDIMLYHNSIDVTFYLSGNSDKKSYIKRKVELVHSSGLVSSNVKIHPEPSIDVAVIKLPNDILDIPNIDLLSLTFSYLLDFDKNI